MESLFLSITELNVKTEPKKKRESGEGFSRHDEPGCIPYPFI